MNPHGNLTSFLIFPSIAILLSLDWQMSLHSLPFKASFNLFLKSTLRGIHSLNLCGPHPGLGAFLLNNDFYKNSTKLAHHPMFWSANSL
jgi:hypothetical protein